MTFDFSKLLSNPERGFIAKITPAPSKVQRLKAIRKVVRDELREKFSDLSSSFNYVGGQMLYVSNESTDFLAEELKKLNHDQKKALKKLKPKFASQGSFVYKTMNSPCQSPQQMDLDDGIYLPLEMFKEKPVIGKGIFFNYVDKTLSQLAVREGWEFCGKKNTCSRIIIDHEMHVDVPLYAVPKERHVAMYENAAVLKAMDTAVGLESATLAKLEPGEVNLALRNAESWTVSDPAVLNDYFKQNFNFYKNLVGGEDLCRRVCRYLKAWRDQAFSRGGPSSVALMTCVVLSFEEMSRTRSLYKLSDADALLECARRLSSQLQKGIPNDAEKEKEEILFPKGDMKEAEKIDIYKAADELYISLQKAVNVKTTSEVVDQLRHSFGERIPNLPELIITLGSAAATILSQPAKAIPQPDVVNQDAG
jgi:hypothetical protein